MSGQHLPLFVSFLKTGLFGFGGGYAILPLISHEVVDVRGWTGAGEFADMVAMSQMTPGPVALNAATYAGYVVEGLPGAIIATAAVCVPPLLIMYAVCRFFMSMGDNRRVAAAMRLLRPTVVGLVLAAAMLLMNRQSFVDWGSAVIFAAAFAATVFWKVHPIPVLLAAGVAGWLFY